MENLIDAFDRLALKYEHNRASFETTQILNEFVISLPIRKGSILDLGCGSGTPVSRFFLDRKWEVHGVDFSQKMLELAKQHTPEMHTSLCDMRHFSAPDNMYDAVVAVYSFFHVPLDCQSDLLMRIQKMLKPGGRFLMTYATKDYTGEDTFDGYKEFMGEMLYYGHDTPEVLHAKLSDAGLHTIYQEDCTINGEVFRWITCEK